MAQTIAVPEALTLSQVTAWLAQIGVDAHDIPASGGTITFERGRMTVEIMARTPEGRRYGTADDRVATHTISIPLVDDR